MTQPEFRAEARPKRYPPPQFPPRRPALFARMPPAVFPSLLGLLGLAGAVRLALGRLGWDPGPGDLLAGGAVALWAFAAFAYGVKLARRPGVVVEDLRILPGRSGLAALTMGGMVAAGLVAAYSVPAAAVLLVLALVGHGMLAVLLLRLLLGLPPEARAVNPTLHLSLVGVIVGAAPALAVGWGWLAETLFWVALPIAVAIWALSLRQFMAAAPPAPLRPLLAIHLAPAALLGSVAGLLARPDLGVLFAGLGAVYAILLAVAGRWLLEAGVSAFWGAFTFPLAALATALMVNGGVWFWPGLLLTALGLVVIPLIAWWVLKRWPGGRLAAATNAAEA
ncbi:tellurium resistance protein [Tabrizicola soli]|uniref:Tellurium resistance protein n=1 Tax=Tabrizicola soli TaxID=2185115 RepID=A0ABV7DWF4_9RHOB|nr:tellurium resistance protein [Tabrizicola soli]